MRYAFAALTLFALTACEPKPGDSGPAGDDSAVDSGASDCSPESVDDPLNPAASGSYGPETINGATCDGWTDEYSVNVSTGCTLSTQLTFPEVREEGELVADGELQVLWYGSMQSIGVVDRVEDGGTVTQTNNPDGDSFGAVRVRVKHTGGERLDYALTVSTSCP